jgi:hypothetical protein
MRHGRLHAPPPAVHTCGRGTFNRRHFQELT